MAEHFIIDGYNLMKTDPELAMFMRYGLETAREAVIKRVDNAAGLKKAASITIVFDGHLNGQPTETQQRRGRILVIFSRLEENADSVIKRLVANYTAQPDQAKVITRDQELKDAARAASQSSGMMKRRTSLNQARQNHTHKDETDPATWNKSTKKKGQAKRPPKPNRKKGPDDDIYW